MSKKHPKRRRLDDLPPYLEQVVEEGDNHVSVKISSYKEQDLIAVSHMLHTV